ncbi:BrnT family toxin [Phenylobacterium sp.]|uniref:BrnT family toxin n=1 Tax=Phenylobacterium sp. TaxID=1871053 RepID=UPI002600336B|nr:BrnT family toxin [Phenylobacterium sp.]
MIAGFDWDEGNSGKCQKHGLSLEAIEAVFRGPFRLAPDLAHSRVETRFLAIGKGDGDRLVLVAFTLRRGGRPDPADQRPVHAREGTASL